MDEREALTADAVAVYHDYIVAGCLLPVSIRASLTQIRTFTLIVHNRRLVAPFLPKVSPKNRGVTCLLDIPVKLALNLTHDRK